MAVRTLYTFSTTTKVNKQFKNFEKFCFLSFAVDLKRVLYLLLASLYRYTNLNHLTADYRFIYFVAAYTS